MGLRLQVSWSGRFHPERRLHLMNQQCMPRGIVLHIRCKFFARRTKRNPSNKLRWKFRSYCVPRGQDCSTVFSNGGWCVFFHETMNAMSLLGLPQPAGAAMKPAPLWCTDAPQREVHHSRLRRASFAGHPSRDGRLAQCTTCCVYRRGPLLAATVPVHIHFNSHP